MGIMRWMMTLAFGAGLMFLLDPESGRRRRALIRDQGIKASRVTREELDGRSRDLRNRLFGLWATFGRIFPSPLADELRHRREARGQAMPQQRTEHAFGR